MVAAIPEEGAGELEEGEVVLGFLLVADEDPSTLAQPSEGSLHDPASMPPGRLAWSSDIDGPLSVLTAPVVFGLAIWRDGLGLGLGPASAGFLAERAPMELTQPLQLGGI